MMALRGSRSSSSGRWPHERPAHVALVTEGGADVGSATSAAASRSRAPRWPPVRRASFVAVPEPRVEAILGALPAPVVALPWTTEPAAALAALRDLGARRDRRRFVQARRRTSSARCAGSARPSSRSTTRPSGALPATSCQRQYRGRVLAYRRAADTAWLLGARYALLDPAYAGCADRPAAPARRSAAGHARRRAEHGGRRRRRPPADAVLRDAIVDVAVGSFGARRAGARRGGARVGEPRPSVHRDRFGLRDVMLAADLAVCGAGMTLYELAAAGTPAITVCMADNQRPNAEAFARGGRRADGGMVARSGSRAGVERALRTLLDASARADVARRAHRLVDGRGAGRVVQWILESVPARRCA